jgi:hypothetical protein
VARPVPPPRATSESWRITGLVPGCPADPGQHSHDGADNGGNAADDGGQSDNHASLAQPATATCPGERAARQKLGDAIAKELCTG